MYMVLMELSAQLQSRKILLHTSWIPRDENEEADSLTNGDFHAFSPSRLTSSSWSSHVWSRRLRTSSYKYGR